MFGQELKAARQAARKKLREVAEVSELTISVISDIEHGRRNPPPQDVVKKIELFLGVTNEKLCKSASQESKIKAGAREIFGKRPALNYALLRAAEGLSDDAVNKLIRDISQEEGDE